MTVAILSSLLKYTLICIIQTKRMIDLCGQMQIPLYHRTKYITDDNKKIC